MYKILLPTDGSDLSQKAVKQGMVFARALHAKVIGLHVIPEVHIPMHEGFMVPTNPTIRKRVEEDWKAAAQRVLASVEREAKGADIECECVVGVNDAIHEEIISTAEKNNCELIIMASHGHAGVTGLLLGSETAKVLTHTKLPILVLR